MFSSRVVQERRPLFMSFSLLSTRKVSAILALLGCGRSSKSQRPNKGFLPWQLTPGHTTHMCLPIQPRSNIQPVWQTISRIGSSLLRAFNDVENESIRDILVSTAVRRYQKSSRSSHYFLLEIYIGVFWRLLISLYSYADCQSNTMERYLPNCQKQPIAVFQLFIK